MSEKADAKTKLLADYVNKTAVAVLVAGLVAPILGMAVSTRLESAEEVGHVALIMVVSALVSGWLHICARIILDDLIRD